MSAAAVSRWAHASGLLVRHWACNMTLVHDQGAVWPGFGYTASEQAVLRDLARRVSSFEFRVWLALVVVFALAAFTLFTLLGTELLVRTSGSLDAVSGVAFIVNGGVELVASLAIGLPAAMLLASVITGRLLNVPDADLPEQTVRTHYVHLLCVQFTRMALVGSGLVVALCLWVPERVWLLTRCVMPVLGPVVSAVGVLFYMHRPRVAAQGAEPAPRDSSSNST